MKIKQRYEKLLLINPHIDEGWDQGHQWDYWQPMNLLALASHLKEKGFEGAIKILDLYVHTDQRMRKVIKDFRPDLVGISPNLISYQRGLSLAKEAKENGADIVFGGNFTSFLFKHVMERQKEKIDFAIQGDGEEALQKLIRGEKLSTIQNLAWRDSKNNVHFNPSQLNRNSSMTEIDYSFIDFDPYFSNHENSGNTEGLKKPITIISQDGCYWRHKTGGCTFCCRLYPDAKFENPKEVWCKLDELKEKYGMDSFLDIGDDFTGNRKWLREFLAQRPKGMEDIAIRFIFARSGDINKETADILAALNTKEIFIGYESGDDEILKSSGKGGTARQNIKATEFLNEREIGVHGSFVAGFKGETKQQLNNTKHHIKKLLEFENMRAVSIAPLAPFLGSPAYDILINNPEMKQKYATTDIINAREMAKDWIREHSAVSFEEVMECISDVS